MGGCYTKKHLYIILFNNAVILFPAVPGVFDMDLSSSTVIFAGCTIGICWKLLRWKGDPKDIP